MANEFVTVRWLRSELRSLHTMVASVRYTVQFEVTYSIFCFPSIFQWLERDRETIY